jgi:hypothetical protein
VLVSIDDEGFEIEPLDERAACTPQSVSAHMLYENADPFRMREPAGTLDTSTATYHALDDRRVRVEGSRFEIADRHTIKLEGAALTGYQTILISGIRDPAVLSHFDEWLRTLTAFLDTRAPLVLGLDPGAFDMSTRCYGYNGVLGDLEPDVNLGPLREVGLVFIATAADQATATRVAKFANPYLLHMPSPGATHLPSFAFLSSPAETERGPIYEFVLQHAVYVTSPSELHPCTIETWEIGA